jgi:hypothetical protein
MGARVSTIFTCTCWAGAGLIGHRVEGAFTQRGLTAILVLTMGV